MTVGAQVDPGWSWDDKFPLAQGVKVGNFLFLSGQVALDGDGNLVGKGDIKEQTRKIFTNIESILNISNCTFDNLVKITAYITDASLYGEYSEVRGKILTNHRPASTTVAVSGLAFKDLLIEIDVVAYI